MEETKKRGRGRPPLPKPEKVKKPMGRPKLGEPLVDGPAVTLPHLVERWLRADDAKHRGVEEAKGKAGPALRRLIAVADWSGAADANLGLRDAAVRLRLTNAALNELSQLATSYGADVSTFVYTRAVLPAYLAAHSEKLGADTDG